MAGYKAVIFDFYGTLVPNFPWDESNIILERMAAELGVDHKKFAEGWNDSFADRMTGVLGSYREVILRICEKLGCPADEDKVELTAAMRAVMNDTEASQPREGAIEVLEYLKEHGYRIALLSDCTTETVRVWPDTVFVDFIDEPLFSCVEGIRKPDPGFFYMAAERLGVKPEECIYVADGMGRELHTAAELGMTSIQILIPGEDEYDHYREDWDGPVITSLREILGFLEPGR